MPERDHNGRYNGGWGVGLCRDHGRLACKLHYGSHTLAQCNNQDAMTGRIAYPTLTDEGPDCDICAAKGEGTK